MFVYTQYATIVTPRKLATPLVCQYGIVAPSARAIHEYIINGC